MEQARKYLIDIKHAIELIEQFLSEVNAYDEYVADLKTQSAVERQLGIIGEAVNQYDKQSNEETLAHTQKIIGFRNRLIHAYDAIEPSIIWTIIKNHLPALKNEVQAKLNAL